MLTGCMYVSRMEGGRLTGCKMFVKAALNGMSNIALTVAARISNTVPSENSTQPKEFKKQDNEERLNN